jgi:hypothetical protein
MKIASLENGARIEASITAPEQAKCPHCECVVVLRHRRRMNNEGVTFYWRHPNNQKTFCRARKRPIA